MFKTLMGIHRRADLSFDEFMTHWTQIHANLISENAAALGIVKYIQLHRPDGSEKARTHSASRPQYDGIAEVWYESEDHFRALGKSDVSRSAAQKVIEDQKKFIGRETPLFKGFEWNVIDP